MFVKDIPIIYQFIFLWEYKIRKLNKSKLNGQLIDLLKRTFSS